MKVVAAFVGLILVLGACSEVADLTDADVVRGSAVIVTETRDTTGFDAVGVTSSGEVSIYGPCWVDPT